MSRQEAELYLDSPQEFTRKQQTRQKARDAGVPDDQLFLISESRPLTPEISEPDIEATQSLVSPAAPDPSPLAAGEIEGEWQPGALRPGNTAFPDNQRDVFTLLTELPIEGNFGMNNSADWKKCIDAIAKVNRKTVRELIMSNTERGTYKRMDVMGPKELKQLYTKLHTKFKSILAAADVEIDSPNVKTRLMNYYGPLQQILDIRDIKRLRNAGNAAMHDVDTVDSDEFFDLISAE